MENESRKFTATQTEKGFHVTFFDSPEELDVSVSDLNEFANKYAKDTLEGKHLELSEREMLMISIWEMMLMPDDIKH